MQPAQQSLDNLLKILACTGCGAGRLSPDAGPGELVCAACGKRYPVINGICSFVPDELVDFSEVAESSRPAFLAAKRLAYAGDTFISRMYNHYHRYAAAQRGKAATAPLTLDLGFGIGEHYPFITERERSAGTFFGADLDRFKLESFHHQHPEIPLVQASALALPFASGSFDVVQILATLEHFEGDDISRVIDEALRVMRPEGMLIACYPAEGGLLLRMGQVLMHAFIRLKTGFDLEHEQTHRHTTTAAGIGRILSDRDDLEQVETSYYPFGVRSIHGSLFVNGTYRKKGVPGP